MSAFGLNGPMSTSSNQRLGAWKATRNCPAIAPVTGFPTVSSYKRGSPDMRKLSWALIALLITIGLASGFARAALAGPHGTQIAGGDNDDQGGGGENGDNDDQGGSGNNGNNDHQ